MWWKEHVDLCVSVHVCVCGLLNKKCTVRGLKDYHCVWVCVVIAHSTHITSAERQSVCSLRKGEYVQHRFWKPPRIGYSGQRKSLNYKHMHQNEEELTPTFNVTVLHENCPYTHSWVVCVLWVYKNLSRCRLMGTENRPSANTHTNPGVSRI